MRGIEIPIGGQQQQDEPDTACGWAHAILARERSLFVVPTVPSGCSPVNKPRGSTLARDDAARGMLAGLRHRPRWRVQSPSHDTPTTVGADPQSYCGLCSRLGCSRGGGHGDGKPKAAGPPPGEAIRPLTRDTPPRLSGAPRRDASAIHRAD
jgi:hypothetical protein